MRKNAFTMIELIFVIVILGILASVAIPKLSATRTDAEISKVAHNVMLSTAEIASYAVSNGQTVNDLKLMSNGVVSLQSSGNAILTDNKAVVSMGGVNDCVTLEVVTVDTTDTLVVTFGVAGADNQCLSLQSAIDVAQYPMKLRGQNVQY